MMHLPKMNMHMEDFSKTIITDMSEEFNKIKKSKCFSAVNRGQRNKSDFYQTPYSMTEQLLECEQFDGNILEPSCGQGAISSVLKKHNYRVIENDISNGHNFLKWTPDMDIDNVVTNPPFSLALEFIRKSKELYSGKIAMLLPLSYLHGQNRYEQKIFNELARVYVFTRYPLLTSKISDDGTYQTGMMVYSWYIFSKGYEGRPEIHWINNNMHVARKKKNDKPIVTNIF